MKDCETKVPRIISVSRRTDIPAFYGDWFLEQVRRGGVVVLHPYRSEKLLVSLKPEDVASFVFWSKNYAPFFRHLEELEKRGYNFVLFFIITGLPRALEPRVPSPAEALATFKALSRKHSPHRVLWRYDPIVLSTFTPPEHHMKTFRALCRQLEGLTYRCYLSFVNLYPKVERNLARLACSGLKLLDSSEEEKLQLAEQLADIAAAHGIEVYSCCNDFLVGTKIKKAHCVDATLLSQLFGLEEGLYKIHPTRKACGCFESTDIGTYGTCGHHCVYCYAATGFPYPTPKKYASVLPEISPQDVEPPLAPLKDETDTTINPPMSSREKCASEDYEKGKNSRGRRRYFQLSLSDLPE
ncbi:DUF1848 domain-containing protein [Moorellaceae bacterium AZ2]